MRKKFRDSHARFNKNVFSSTTRASVSPLLLQPTTSNIPKSTFIGLSILVRLGKVRFDCLQHVRTYSRYLIHSQRQMQHSTHPESTDDCEMLPAFFSSLLCLSFLHQTEWDELMFERETLQDQPTDCMLSRVSQCVCMNFSRGILRRFAIVIIITMDTQ